VDVVALAGTIAAEIGFGVFPAWVWVALGFGDRLVVDRAVGFYICRISGPGGLGVEQQGMGVQQQKAAVRTRVRRQLLELFLNELHSLGVPTIAAIVAVEQHHRLAVSGGGLGILLGSKSGGGPLNEGAHLENAFSNRSQSTYSSLSHALAISRSVTLTTFIRVS